MRAYRGTYRALAALLDYPTAELVGALPELAGAIASEALLSRRAQERLSPLLEALANTELLELEERYVELFDRSRALSLNLFEHVHGEGRDRGQAMVDLKQKYVEAGFDLTGHELPDYLPAFLEYLSVLPEDEGRGLLAECAHILQAIEAAAARRESLYAGVFAALIELAGAVPQEAEAEPAAEDESLEALDRAWQEDPITFMGGCAPQQPAAVSFVRFHKGARP